MVQRNHLTAKEPSPEKFYPKKKGGKKKRNCVAANSVTRLQNRYKESKPNSKAATLFLEKALLPECTMASVQNLS